MVPFSAELYSNETKDCSRDYLYLPTKSILFEQNKIYSEETRPVTIWRCLSVF